jgi:glucose-6-phosphate 1-dehydrogenase
MLLKYETEWRVYPSEACGRLLLEAMAGDASLLLRCDTVGTAWDMGQAIRNAQVTTPLTHREFHAAGDLHTHGILLAGLVLGFRIQK